MKKTIYISEETFNELTKPKKKKTSHLNPDKWYEDKADFSISSSEGDLGYAHVAGGDASFGGMMENKTVFITEEQAGKIRLLLEGDDRIKKVNRIMDTAFNGILNLDDVVTSPEYYINGDRSTTWRKYILFSFRHTFGLMTNADMQYLPFVARLAFSDEVGFEKRNDNGAEISKLQKIVNYLKKDSKFFNEIKANPSITFSEVCTRLEPILKEMDAADLEAANRVETRDDYEIKVVPDFETANYYGNHTCSTSKLCYTQSSNTWDSYTKHGENKVYVCLKNGWENIPEEPGPGNPYDEYGTSIIFVFINPDGDMVYSNCRWNHSTVGSYNGSVDNAFTKASLSQTVGVRFENVFKPFSPEELAEKGIKVRSSSFVQKKIDEGTPLDEIFDWVDKEKKFGIDDCFIVSFYGDEDEYYDKFNIVLNGKLLSSTWATSIPKIYNVSGRIFFEFINNRSNDGTYYSVIDENGNLLGGTRFSCILEFINSMKCFIVENREEKFNLLRIDGRILSQTWFEYVQQPWTGDIGGDAFPCVIVSVKKNNKTYSDKLYNLMDADGRLLSQEWFSDMTNFQEGFARVEREDGNSNLIGLDGKLISNEWFFDCNTFSGGLARIIEKNPSDNKLYVNFIDKFGELYSNQWFKRSERAYYSFGRIYFVWREDGKVSFINQNNILINEWFDSIGNFDGIWALVSNDKKENFINYAGGLFSEFWFDSFFGNPGTARGSGFLVGQWMNGKWNAIDIKDRTLVSEYGFNSMEEMSNALLDKKPSVTGELLHENINYSKFNMLCEGVNDTDLHKYIESYLDFLERNNYKINPRPAIEFNNEQQDGMNIRTGYYDPDERKVVVFINGRHIKDILRSFAHEMVHHMQNLRDEHMDWGHGGDLVDDDKLRELEGEAYHVGNILFREWTEELKKTRKLDESKIFNLILENEGTNMKKARRYLENLGYSVEKRQSILDAIRTDIPNSRLQQCKFLLGVTRMYIKGELNGHKEIAELNKVLKYIASDAHVNEYDYNLNGENLDTLVSRFSSVATDGLQKSMDVSNSRRLTANASYTIVPIDTPEDAYDYGDYTTWCVTQDENMYNSYTQGGTGRFYFCLRDGFEDEPEVVGEGCPLDSYGLSMIAVSVTQSGELNTVTCRWNHDNGGNDNIMTLEELENVLGRNFYKTFVPYTEEELIAKGVITVGYAEKLLENGTTFDELFEDYHDLGNGYSCVYTCDLTGDDDYGDNVLNYNIINNKTKKFVFREWLDFVDDTFIDGALLIGKKSKCNYLDKNLKLISSEWFQDASPFGTNGAPQGFGEVRLNGKYNFINANGEYLWNIWFDDIMFIEYCLCGVVNDKSATYVLKDYSHGKFVFNPNNPEASLLTNVLRESTKIRRKPENTEKWDGLNEATENDVDLSSFKVQDKLNPKIWVNDLMDSRVRLKLLDIAQDFVEFLDVTWVKPEDTIVVGSIANYNWSRYSDIDLHVVIDYSKVDDRKKFVENYFQSKKKEWNDTHDKISIFGFPVELYVQDKDADNASSAVYSIDKNKWLKKPTRNTFTKKDIDSESIKKMASKIMTDIENIEDDDKDGNDEYKNRKLYDRSSSLIDNITNKRKKSLSATKDEMNTDNLVFKVLRRNGYLDKLFSLRDKTYDKMNSLD